MYKGNDIWVSEFPSNPIDGMRIYREDLAESFIWLAAYELWLTDNKELVLQALAQPALTTTAPAKFGGLVPLLPNSASFLAVELRRELYLDTDQGRGLYEFNLVGNPYGDISVTPTSTSNTPSGEWVAITDSIGVTSRDSMVVLTATATNANAEGGLCLATLIYRLIG